MGIGARSLAVSDLRPGPYPLRGLAEGAFKDIQTTLAAVGARSVTCHRYPPGPQSPLLSVSFEIYFNQATVSSVCMHKGIEYDYADEIDHKAPPPHGGSGSTNLNYWFIYSSK